MASAGGGRVALSGQVSATPTSGRSEVTSPKSVMGKAAARRASRCAAEAPMKVTWQPAAFFDSGVLKFFTRCVGSGKGGRCSSGAAPQTRARYLQQRWQR